MTAHTTDFSAQDTAPDDVSTTIEVAKQLGLAVRSVQLMVDRGELVAWKTAGGHRRISRESLDRWRADERFGRMLGCPGIADPGAKVAALAHQKGIRVAPLVGPSSILLSLMASGLNGQRFTFLGYIPSDKNARINQLKEIEKKSRQQETQVFIETPYRNQHMLEDILASCQAETRLCIACNISLHDEYIVTKRVKEWKQSALPDLHKKPTVFLLLA